MSYLVKIEDFESDMNQSFGNGFVAGVVLALFVQIIAVVVVEGVFHVWR